MKKLSLFSKIYLGVISAFLALLVAVLCVLWNWLGAYEVSLSKNIAADVVKNIENGSFDIKSVQKTEFDLDSDIKAYFDNLKGKEIGVFKPAGATEQDNTFVLKSGDERVATIFVKENGEKGKFGFTQFELESISIASKAESMKIRVPKNYKVLVNGIEVGSKYITNDNADDPIATYLPKDVKAVEYVEYTVDKPMVFHGVSVSDGKKTEVVELKDGETVYTVKPFSQNELSSIHSEFILKAMKAYSYYLFEKKDFYTVTPYLEHGSPFYKKSATIDNNWVRGHSGCKFQNESITDFYKYDENTVACHFKMDVVMNRWGKGEYRDKIDMTLILRNKGDGYKIYNSISVAE